MRRSQKVAIFSILVLVVIGTLVATNVVGPEEGHEAARQEVSEEDPSSTNAVDSSQEDELERHSVQQPPAANVARMMNGESEETQQWLRDAGISDTEADRFFRSASISDLRRYASEGDLTAKKWLGIKLAANGDTEEALEALMSAAAEGSIAAAHSLAELYMGMTSSFPLDKTEAYAWLRIAQILGDPMATIVPLGLGQTGGAQFTPEEYIHAEARFFDLLFELQNQHQALYGTPLPFNPRPMESLDTGTDDG